MVGPRINWYRYFDNNAFTFFFTGASSYNSSGGTLVNAIDRGSGAVVTWDINDLMTFKVGYLGENTEFLPIEATYYYPINQNIGLYRTSDVKLLETRS